MNIQTIQCPSCGGNLEVKNVNQSLVYCMFCGASISLETNHNKGYDMELGRLDARGEMADEVLAKIEKIKPELIRNGDAARRRDEYTIKVSDLKGMLFAERTSGWGTYVIKPFLKGLLFLFIGALIVVFLNSVLPEFLLTILEYVVLLAPIYSPVIGLLIKLSKHKRIKDQIRSSQAILDDAEREYAETESFLEKNAEVEIPPKFRSERVLGYIVKGFQAREFVSLEQAFFKSEEMFGI